MDLYMDKWRWGELNPRPEKGNRSVYRLIGARCLSGSGSSTASVESVVQKKSPYTFAHRLRASPDWRRNTCFARSSAKQVPRLCSYCVIDTVVIFGSYSFYRIRRSVLRLQPRLPAFRSKPEHPHISYVI